MEAKKKTTRKKEKSLLSRINAWLHLWLGISSGLIVVFVAFTGTVIVYCDELLDLSAGKSLYVKEVKDNRLPVDTLLKNIQLAFPEREAPVLMTSFKDPERTVKFRMFSDEKGLSMVYVDPYSGVVLKDDGFAHFFYIMAHLHSSLLLHDPGIWIVDIATIIFLIELITGLVLWWPAKWTQRTREASFTIKWKATFKRLNYDLHNVPGFYSLLPALVLTITGLLIAFEPLMDMTSKTFGGREMHEWEASLPGYQAGRQQADVNQTIGEMFRQHPDARAAELALYDWDSSGYYTMWVARKMGLKSAEGAHLKVIDKYSGASLAIPPQHERAEVIDNINWTLHMGVWRGQLGKFVTFVAGLICTSLPITGFIIWWGRGRKKKKAAPQRSGVSAG
ncbi:PepSY-associated TM helix domain-containing protein [Chitinophaga nivalis]|uniref:PepSY domain-containing protein n=1 Tax=Chitinophaga nivalis TaxID=2991709 RepID=A0ABT3IIT8_9BACT|nr:PepSY-associated TM helix domain-containing protein [Chitinophaga nivalis]MCW3466451.1 PepSY domain-containing protein [Chitinophaga nivalis]MCW3483858.1 PepSY domain-containing protein [Chitinophaga nivalis]